MVSADFSDMLEQGIEGATGEVVAVEGNQAGVGGDQRGQGVEVHRRWGVDPDLVVAGERVEGVLQLVDLVPRLQLGLQFLKRGMSR